VTEAPRGSSDELVRHFLTDERFEDFVDTACDEDLRRRERAARPRPLRRGTSFPATPSERTDHVTVCTALKNGLAAGRWGLVFEGPWERAPTGALASEPSPRAAAVRMHGLAPSHPNERANQEVHETPAPREAVVR